MPKVAVKTAPKSKAKESGPLNYRQKKLIEKQKEEARQNWDMEG